MEWNFINCNSPTSRGVFILYGSDLLACDFRYLLPSVVISFSGKRPSGFYGGGVS
jgi:hypothetical protein